MKKRGWAWLLLVVLLCAGVRVSSFWLPGIPESKRAFFQDVEGEPYLTEMDSYFYARMARTMAEENGIRLYNHRLSDPLMGPREKETPASQGDPLLLSILTFWIWKGLSLFFGVSVIQVARWIGPAFGALAAVPAFLYVRRRTNLPGGVTAGILAGAAIPFVCHSFAGFFDTDSLLGVLPLGMVTAFLTAVQEKRIRRQAGFSLLSGACFGLLSLTWSSFHTYFWLLVLGGILSGLLILAVPSRIPFRRRLTALRGFGMTVGCALLFLLLLRGPTGVRVLGNVLSTFRSVTGGGPSAYPYAHQYTSEMQAIPGLPEGGMLSLFQGGTESLLNRLGGVIPCLLAAAGVILILLIPFLRRREGEQAPAAEERLAGLSETGILILWLAAGLKLSLGSQRIAEIAALPFAVLAGLGVGTLTGMARRWPAARGILSGALPAVCCVSVVLGAWSCAWNDIPYATDARAEAMEWIRDNTPAETALASWWDDGYFNQYTSRRRDLADGGSSSGVLNYYLGHILLSDQPAEAAGLLRMLENSSTAAVSFLTARGMTELETAKLLPKLVSLPRTEAEALLCRETALEETDRTTLLDRTHPAENPPLYLVLSTDLLSKAGALTYYGLWDPEAGRPGSGAYFLMSRASRPIERNTECVFSMGGSGEELRIRRDAAGEPELVRDPKNMFYNASSLSRWKDGKRTGFLELEGDGPAVFLLEEEGRFCAFACSPNLRDSLLVRLFVCGDREVPGFEAVGTWLGAENGDPALTQTRINARDLAACSVQLWRVSGPEPDGAP